MSTSTVSEPVNVLNLSAGCALVVHCEGLIDSLDEGERAFSVRSLALREQLNRSLAKKDIKAAIVAAFELGQHLKNWEVKDLIEPDADFGISRRRLPSIAGKASAEKRRRKALRRARQILREIRGKRVSKAQALRQIDERNLLQPGSTARALQRASKHLPKPTKKVATRTK